MARHKKKTQQSFILIKTYNSIFWGIFGWRNNLSFWVILPTLFLDHFFSNFLVAFLTYGLRLKMQIELHNKAKVANGTKKQNVRVCLHGHPPGPVRSALYWFEQNHIKIKHETNLQHFLSILIINQSQCGNS